MRRIGMGLVGPGFVGAHHIDAVRRLGFVDVVAIAESNAFLVVSPEKLHWDAGEMAMVLPRRGVL